MRNHKAAKHGIDVVWHTCPNCDFKAIQKSDVTRHLKLNYRHKSAAAAK